jgi:biopolymer transport protein ExbB
MRLFDYIQQGGVIMYILLAINIVGFAIMLSKLLIYGKEKRRTEEVAGALGKKVTNSIDTKDSGAIIELAKQELSSHIGEMEKGLNTIKIIAAISPLLGLLGTVIGVLVAFKVMSQTGLNNPATFAQGISMALITTVGGMIVSIPHYVGHNYLVGMLDNIESKLEKTLLAKVL